MEVSLPRIECTQQSDTYARFEIDPLGHGYGTTLGNALRRVLLSSLPGAAITAVKIDDIRHEFSDIPGVVEDVTEFILNLKRVRIRSFSDEPVHLTLGFEGEGNVTAGDIEATDLVEIVNPDQHLATVDSPHGRLFAELTVEKGIGYHDISDLREENRIGEIPVDGIYSPVERVNFTVERTRVGNMTNYDKLILELWTDGTINPTDALTNSAQILTRHFQHISTFGREPEEGMQQKTLTNRPLPAQEAEMPIDELPLSARGINALKRAGLTKVGQVLAMNPDDLMSIRNFGAKSYDELMEILRLRKLIPDDAGNGAAQ